MSKAQSDSMRFGSGPGRFPALVTEVSLGRAGILRGLEVSRRRGELFLRPPIGFAHNPLGRLVLDPDQQIQSTLRLLFDTFRRTGSTMATVREFRQSHLLFPRRIQSGPSKGTGHRRRVNIDYHVAFDDTEKAETLLCFRATTSLSEILDEVIPCVAEQIEVGQI